MNGRSTKWMLVFLVLVAAALGYGAYNLGVSHGLALSGSLAAAPAPGMPQGLVYPYGWHRHWGGGFFVPFLFFGFWFLAARAFFWRGPWRRRSYGAGCGEVPPLFDQWHRRAHEQMKSDTPAD